MVVLALLSASHASGQTRVRGLLLDERTSTPVPGAVVEILGTAGERYGATLSDSAGMFVLSAPGPGRYQVRAVHADYAPTLSTAFALDEDNELVDLRLYVGVEVVRLAPIEVIGRSSFRLMRGRDIFNANQELGLGRFITAEDIAARDPHGISYMLQGEDGIIPNGMPDGSMMYTPTRTLCVVSVVDGIWRSTTPRIGFIGPGAMVAAYESMTRRITNPRSVAIHETSVTVDQVIMPEDVAGFEFYRESSEVPEYWVKHARNANEIQLAQNLRFSCGLLVMWTKGGW